MIGLPARAIRSICCATAETVAQSRFLRQALLALGVLGAGAAVAASEASSVRICYNYGCSTTAEVQVDRLALRAVQRRLAAAADAIAERAALAQAIGRLYRLAARQTPVAADRAGNFLDAGADGRMDCIDHSTSTTRLLQLIEERGWMRYHRVVAPARRSRFIFQHFSAVIEERALDAEADSADGSERRMEGDEHAAARYVVDSWFVDNGEAAVVMPLAEWLNGGGPNVQ